MYMLSMLVCILSKPTFEQWIMFQGRGNHVLKGATFNRKHMAHKEHIISP